MRNRRLLKCSAEADNTSAEEWPTPSSHHDSKVWDYVTNEQPMPKPVARVNQSMNTSDILRTVSLQKN